MEQVFLHLASEASVWSPAKPPHPLQRSHIRPPYILEVIGGGVECILPCVMWLFAEQWVDLALWCHTHTHARALTILEVCETDLLSAGGLGPHQHFLQTENRGSSQLKPGWGNNESSSRHQHHLIPEIIETVSSYFSNRYTSKSKIMSA